MKKIKKILGSMVVFVMLAASMPVITYAKDNSGIDAHAIIERCPVCMMPNIITHKASTKYSYEGQTRYVTDTYFDYCRDCGFRTPDRTVTYRDPNQ